MKAWRSAQRNPVTLFAPPGNECGHYAGNERGHLHRWGKQRIADELAKANTWVPVISPNTVKRILQDAGLWTPAATPEKGGLLA